MEKRGKKSNDQRLQKTDININSKSSKLDAKSFAVLAANKVNFFI